MEAFCLQVSKDRPAGRLYTAAGLFTCKPPGVFQRVLCIIQGLGADHPAPAWAAILRMVAVAERRTIRQADQYMAAVAEAAISHPPAELLYLVGLGELAFMVALEMPHRREFLRVAVVQ